MKKSNLYLLFLIGLLLIRHFYHPEWTSLEMISAEIFLGVLFALELLEEIKERLPNAV